MTSHDSLHPQLSPHHGAPPTTLHTPSLHDALPISSSATRTSTPRRRSSLARRSTAGSASASAKSASTARRSSGHRSEEHTSEVQSRRELVCRLLREKKKYRVRRIFRPRSQRRSELS